MENLIKQPFTNAQLEVLKVLSHDLQENELLELKKILVKFLSEKLISIADAKWEEEQWTDKEMDLLVSQKHR